MYLKLFQSFMFILFYQLRKYQSKNLFLSIKNVWKNFLIYIFKNLVHIYKIHAQKSVSKRTYFQYQIDRIFIFLEVITKKS